MQMIFTNPTRGRDPGIVMLSSYVGSVGLHGRFSYEDVQGRDMRCIGILFADGGCDIYRDALIQVESR